MIMCRTPFLFLAFAATLMLKTEAEDVENYGHFTNGERISCGGGTCGYQVFKFSIVRASLLDFIGTTIDVDYYGDFWGEEYEKTNVPEGYCHHNTITPTTQKYPGISFSRDKDAGIWTLESTSIPNHDMEDYCSAQGGSLPPLIGTDFDKLFSTEFTKRPSNQYRTSISNSIGFAVNGVQIFSPFTAIDTLATTDETLDTCNGHPANGVYHYHGFSSCIFGEEIGASDPEHSKIYGWAYDGFPIYGPYGYSDPEDSSSDIVLIKTGYVNDGESTTNPEDWSYNGTGHLDECNGRFTKTPEFPGGRYVYYLNVDDSGNPEFPAVPYCYHRDYE